MGRFPRRERDGRALRDPRSGRKVDVRMTKREVTRRRAANEERLASLVDEFDALGLDPVHVSSSDPVEILAAFLDWPTCATSREWHDAASRLAGCAARCGGRCGRPRPRSARRGRGTIAAGRGLAAGKRRPHAFAAHPRVRRHAHRDGGGDRRSPIRPRLLRVQQAFSPWESIVPLRQTREDSKTTSLIRTTYVLRCVISPCVPRETSQLEFDRRRVVPQYRRAGWPRDSACAGRSSGPLTARVGRPRAARVGVDTMEGGSRLDASRRRLPSRPVLTSRTAVRGRAAARACQRGLRCGRCRTGSLSPSRSRSRSRCPCSRRSSSH